MHFGNCLVTAQCAEGEELSPEYLLHGGPRWIGGGRAEPLRETACAALTRVHLAGGNESEALRAFERLRTLLAAELGIEPTPGLRNCYPNGSGSNSAVMHGRATCGVWHLTEPLS